MARADFSTFVVNWTWYTENSIMGDQGRSKPGSRKPKVESATSAST